MGVAVEEEELPRVIERGRWLTVDGPWGLQEQDAARTQARNFFYAGFALLPWLWVVNCFYFWPVLRNRIRNPDPLLRSYILRSAIGALVYTSLLLAWALTYTIGGEHLFGPLWNNLSIYRIADEYMGSLG